MGITPADQARKRKELIAPAKAGDAEAWGELTGSSRPPFSASAARDATHGDAEDATMDIVIQSPPEIIAVRSSRPFSAWLIPCGRSLLGLLRRRKGRQDLETGEIENMPLEHPDPGQLEQLIEQRTSQKCAARSTSFPRAQRNGARAALLRGS